MNFGLLLPAKFDKMGLSQLAFQLLADISNTNKIGKKGTPWFSTD